MTVWQKIWQILKGIGRLLGSLLRGIWTLLKLGLSLLGKLLLWLKTVILKILNKPAKVLAALFFLACLSFFTAYFVPSTQPFEGNLVVKEISFTANSSQNKRFFNAINKLSRLEFGGIPHQPVTLTGNFSTNEPQLNEKLKTLTQITIELSDINSQFILSPGENQLSKLNILSLELFPQTRVHRLTYNPYNHQLSFCLSTATTAEASCLFPKSLSSSETLAKLNLQIGQQPLNLSVENFSIPELEIATNPDNPNYLEIQWTPDVLQERELTLASPSTLYLSLPKPTAKVNPRQWLRGDLDVKAVRFYHPDITGNVPDEILISSILKGKIRLADRSIELEANQFLQTTEPGIKKLHHLQIQTEEPKGLQIRFSGKSRKIEVGLDPNFPVKTIESSRLATLFRPEAGAALLGFVTAVAVFSLSYLFTP